MDDTDVIHKDNEQVSMVLEKVFYLDEELVTRLRMVARWKDVPLRVLVKDVLTPAATLETLEFQERRRRDSEDE
jgi:hypothetical protein